MAVCILVLTEQFPTLSTFSLYTMLGLFFFCLLFLLTEFRKRADVFILSENQIEKRSFFGIGYALHFDLEELDGFTEMEYYSKKYIHLIKNGKRVACCCNFHMRNYDEVKKALGDTLIFLGEENYSLKAEVAYLIKL
ncbi:hypothetical protein LDL79_17030 [Leeuwenhoekiella palythoae]|uniref:hypothetical protein n=1 Tax=Leeuwenhoekiella palythoae TaxID=573501 RepID=UPI001CE1391E|nr:hypothetical protein [Leeuwenhoekiella palythoae]UBZ10490.1 hypothetical protein LDL79_17030 [Leeuwenhoekiella palythoae]